jgi:hypothetical protein
MEEKQIDAVELAAVDRSGGGELKHALKGDRRMIGVGFFSDETGPHGVVKFHDG